MAVQKVISRIIADANSSSSNILHVIKIAGVHQPGTACQLTKDVPKPHEKCYTHTLIAHTKAEQHTHRHSLTSYTFRQCAFSILLAAALCALFLYERIKFYDINHLDFMRFGAIRFLFARLACSCFAICVDYGCVKCQSNMLFARSEYF